MDWTGLTSNAISALIGVAIGGIVAAEWPNIRAAFPRGRTVLRMREVPGGGAWEVENRTRFTLFELRYSLSGDGRALTPSQYADSDVRDLAPGMSVRLVGFSHVAGQTAGFDWIERSGRRGGLVTFAKDRSEYSVEREPLPKPRRGQTR